jgi:hypothetical protein
VVIRVTDSTTLFGPTMPRDGYEGIYSVLGMVWWGL